MNKIIIRGTRWQISGELDSRRKTFGNIDKNRTFSDSQKYQNRLHKNYCFVKTVNENPVNAEFNCIKKHCKTQKLT